MPLNQGRRLAPASLKSKHIGLWLDRYLELQTWHQDRVPAGYDKDRARKARDRLVQEALDSSVPQGYPEAFLTWRTELDDQSDRIAVAPAKGQGRILVGSGQKNPAEFGITLHRTWGLPYLPGSSLKGIAAWGAHHGLGDAWLRDQELHKALFGDVEEQGAVIFHDAMLLSGQGIGLAQDVLTVHHPDYYQKDAEPSDTDSPIPVPFISAHGAFLVAIELHPSLDPVAHGHWLRAAWEALRFGLREHGIGAKTNAGYGRVELPAWEETSTGKVLAKVEAERIERERQEVERQRFASMGPAQRVREVHVADLRSWLEGGEHQYLCPDEGEIRLAARRVKEMGVARGLRASVREPWRDWVQEELERVEAPVVVLPTRAPLSVEAVDRAVVWDQKKKRYDLRKAAQTLAGQCFTVADCDLALERLRAKGASDSELSGLLQRHANLSGTP